MGRLVAWAVLDEVLAEHRRQGRTIVSTNGCFDLLHAGHVFLLTAAAAQGQVLVVGLNSDVSVRALKGPHRPILPQADRVAVLCALACVDYVVLFDEPDCLEFVRRVRPEVHVNDIGYGPECIEAQLVRENGGRLHLVERIPGLSTSAIIRKTQEMPHGG